jgi:hypothetical protein
MTVCPAELVQVTDGPPLALFADGLDTAIYRLDPGIRRFRCLSARDGLVTSMSASRSGAVVAALATTSYEPLNAHAGPPGGPLLPLTDTRPALRAIRWVAETITARSRAQVARFFDGLELAEPGLVRITQWDSGPGLEPAGAAALWAGLARKPG